MTTPAFLSFANRRALYTALLTLCVSCVLINASVADAKWYNPSSWFKSSQSTSSSSQPLTKNRTLPPAKTDLPPLQETANATKNGAIIKTEKGNIIIAFYSKEAPITVKNFKQLAGDKFYNAPGMVFHRVVEGFVIQTGDPTGTGYGGSDKTIPLEAKNKLSHDSIGVVAMARGPLPNSATSQFYITLDKHTSLDGKYAIFAEVLKGLSVVQSIQQGDRLYGIELTNIDDVVKEDRKKWNKQATNWNPFH